MDIELLEQLSQLEDDADTAAFNAWLLEGNMCDMAWSFNDEPIKPLNLDDLLLLMDSSAAALCTSSNTVRPYSVVSNVPNPVAASSMLHVPYHQQFQMYNSIPVCDSSKRAGNGSVHLAPQVGVGTILHATVIPPVRPSTNVALLDQEGARLSSTITVQQHQMTSCDKVQTIIPPLPQQNCVAKPLLLNEHNEASNEEFLAIVKQEPAIVKQEPVKSPGTSSTSNKSSSVVSSYRIPVIQLSTHQRYRQRKKQAHHQMEKQIEGLQHLYNSLIEENSNLHERVQLLNTLAKICNDQVQILTSLQLHCQGTVCDGLDDGPIKLFAQAAGMDREHITADSIPIYYHRLIGHFSNLLMDLSNSNDPIAALTRLNHDFDQSVIVFHRLTLLHPEALTVVAGLNMQTGKPGIADAALWRAALKGAKPTREQIRKTRLAMQILADSIKRLSVERTTLVNDFSKLSLNSNSTLVGDTLLSIGHVEETLQRLQRASNKQATMGRLMFLNMSHILTSVQKMTVTVLMYPYFPDSMAMCAAMLSLDPDDLSSGDGA